MTIRPATIEDISFIKQHLIDSWVEHAKHEPDLLDIEAMKKSSVEEYYEAALKSSDCYVLVAEVDGKIAGTVRADVEEISKFFKNNTILYIDDVCVAPEFRRQGIAEALLAEVEQIAQKRGIHRLQGRVYTFNKPIQQLLRKAGLRAPYATWDKVLK